MPWSALCSWRNRTSMRCRTWTRLSQLELARPCGASLKALMSLSQPPTFLACSSVEYWWGLGDASSLLWHNASAAGSARAPRSAGLSRSVVDEMSRHMPSSVDTEREDIGAGVVTGGVNPEPLGVQGIPIDLGDYERLLSDDRSGRPRSIRTNHARPAVEGKFLDVLIQLVTEREVGRNIRESRHPAYGHGPDSALDGYEACDVGCQR